MLSLNKRERKICSPIFTRRCPMETPRGYEVLEAIVKRQLLQEKLSLDPVKILRSRGMIKEIAEQLPGVSEFEMVQIVIPIILRILDEAKTAYQELLKRCDGAPTE